VAVSASDSVAHPGYTVSARRLRPRGWLMRRLLLAADLVGLTTAFLLAMVFSPSASVADAVERRWEIALFVASLPLWTLLLRVHGVYDRDEERTDHSTVDDIFGVFQVVSMVTWGFLVARQLSVL